MTAFRRFWQLGSCDPVDLGRLGHDQHRQVPLQQLGAAVGGMAHEKWGDMVEDELGSVTTTSRTLSGVLQEVGVGGDLLCDSCCPGLAVLLAAGQLHVGDCISGTWCP